MFTFRFELYLGGSWVNVTSYVRQKNAVSIKRGKGDESVKLQPAMAKLVLNNADDRFNPRNPTGPYYGLLVRNTPIRIFAVVGGVDYPRFYGEVYSFAPRWNENRSDSYVPIEAAGVLRRIIKNQTPPKSSYRQWMNNHAGNPAVKYYWPLEDGSDATEGQPDIGSSAAVFNTAPLKKAWGAGEMNDWFPNGVKIEDLNGLVFPCDMRGSSGSAWEMTALMNFPNADCTLLYEINCSTQTWYIYVSSVTDRVMVVDPNGGVDISPFSLGALKDVGPIWMTFRVSFVSGTLNAYVTWDRLAKPSNAINVEVAAALSLPLQFPRYAVVSNGSNAVLNGISGDVTINLSNVSFSTGDVGSLNINTTLIKMKGQPNEEAGDRFDRLSADQGVNTGILGAYGSYNAKMGRQFVQDYSDHLEEIQASSEGVIVESRSSDALLFSGGAYRWGTYVNTTTISYGQLVQSIEPVEDDQLTTNQVTVANKAAGSFVLSKPTGVMSIDEIGLFASKLDVNSYWPSGAVSLGYNKLARGTQDVPRIPSLTVSAAAKPANYTTFLNVEVGEHLLLTGFSPAGYFDDLRCRVVGIEESITPADHRITYNVVPSDINYNVFAVLNGAGTSGSRLEMDDCTTSALVNSTATTIDVETPTSRWTTTPADWPFGIRIAGERMTVTAVSNVDSNTQRFTVTRSVNGVVKSIPAGSSVELYPRSYLAVF